MSERALEIFFRRLSLRFAVICFLGTAVPHAVVAEDNADRAVPSAPPINAAVSSIQSITAPAQRIDVIDFKEMDVADVLKVISQKSGINIVAGNNVTGRVTLYLKDVDVRDVLNIIAMSNDLAFAEKDNLIHVMTGADYERNYGRKFFKKTGRVIQKLIFVHVIDVLPLLERMKSAAGTIIADDKTNTIVLVDMPGSIEEMQAFLKEVDVPRITDVIELNYARAEDIAEKINPILTPNVGTIRFDKRSNKISVTDIPNKLEEISRVVHAFDVKEREVAIEARIVQVILNDRFRMGIDWQGLVEEYHDMKLIGNFDVLGANDKKGELSVGTLAQDNYEAMIQALTEYGTTNNLSSPHIIAVNNQEAKILVGSSEPYVTSTTTTPASGPTTVAESINFIEVGVKLYVTPTIHKDGYVTMKIKPEVSSVTKTITTGNNNTIPVVETSEAETTVIVKDGVTIIIGGLIKDEKIHTDKKVPVLGDIPLLGTLFRSKDHSLRKTELVIFLTPRIISGDSPVADTTMTASPASPAP